MCIYDSDLVINEIQIGGGKSDLDVLKVQNRVVTIETIPFCVQ